MFDKVPPQVITDSDQPFDAENSQPLTTLEFIDDETDAITCQSDIWDEIWTDIVTGMMGG